MVTYQYYKAEYDAGHVRYRTIAMDGALPQLTLTCEIDGESASLSIECYRRAEFLQGTRLLMGILPRLGELESELLAATDRERLKIMHREVDGCIRGSLDS